MLKQILFSAEHEACKGKFRAAGTFACFFVKSVAENTHLNPNSAFTILIESRLVNCYN